MKNYKDFLGKHMTAQPLNKRLQIFIDEYKNYHKTAKKSLSLLDIGCGDNPVIFEHKIRKDIYTGCDYYKKINTQIDQYFQIDLMAENLSAKTPNKKYDVIFCGEVIEHLFSPEHLLSEIRKLMHSDSILILSTPNLGYYVNRILLLFGISPLYLENSSKEKLGRKFSFLGQGNPTEGHVKVFTYGALRDLIDREGYKVEKVISSSGPWNFFLDDYVSYFSRSLSGTNIFVLKKRK
jgi:SAM-dependent methyltransferase